MTETIKTLDELEEIVFELKAKIKERNSELQKEIDKLELQEFSNEKEKGFARIRIVKNYRDKENAEIQELQKGYLNAAEDDIDHVFRRRQLNTANVNPSIFFTCSKEKFEEARKVTRRDAEKEWYQEKEIEREKEEWRRKELGLGKRDKKKERQKILALNRDVNRELEKIPDEEIEQAIINGLIAEKGLAFSLLLKGLKREIEINWDYKTWWIGDIIAWAIWKEYGAFDSKEDEKYFRETDKEMLKGVEEHFAELKEKAPVEWTLQVLNASFTCEEMREQIGKTIKQLSNRECYELVKRFAGTQIVRSTKRKEWKERDEYLIFGEFANICKIHFMETGSISTKTGEPKFDFTAIFDTAASLDLWLSIRLKMFDPRDKNYYKLQGTTQLIVRAIGWTKRPSNLSLECLVKIAGIKDTNINRQQQKVEAYLKEAKKAGYIKGWKKDVKREGIGGRMKALYKIFKVEEWPKN